MAIGSLTQQVQDRLDNKDIDFEVPGIALGPWIKKKKYEEREIVLDLREADDDGTLDIGTALDKQSNKFIPQIRMVSGCLIIKLKRER